MTQQINSIKGINDALDDIAPKPVKYEKRKVTKEDVRNVAIEWVITLGIASILLFDEPLSKREFILTIIFLMVGLIFATKAVWDMYKKYHHGEEAEFRHRYKFNWKRKQ